MDGDLDVYTTRTAVNNVAPKTFSPNRSIELKPIARCLSKGCFKFTTHVKTLHPFACFSTAELRVCLKLPPEPQSAILSPLRIWYSLVVVLVRAPTPILKVYQH